MDMLEKIYGFFNDHFKRKMILTTIIILTIITILIEGMIYFVDIPIQMKNAMSSNSREVQYISERLDSYIKDYEGFLNTITMDQELQNLLSKEYHSSLDEKLLNFDIEKRLNFLTLYSSDRIQNIFLYDTDRLRGFKINSFDYNRELLQLNLNRYNKEGTLYWQIVGNQVYIHRAIINRNSLKIIGYITLGVNKESLINLIKSSENRHTYIFNNSEELVAENGTGPKLQLEKVLKLAKDRSIENNQIVKVEPIGDILVTKYKSNYSLWTTVSFIRLDQITEGSRTLAKWIVIIGIISIMLGTLITWLASNRLIHPLDQLKSIMEHVEKDEYNVRVHINRRDEFGLLGKSFNNMMNKIEHLISAVYQKEISRKEAEYKALKAQINPHFLFNTLETIRSLAEFKENEKIESVVISLSKLLKNSISNHKDFITVREELEYINAYLTIQNTRFQNKVSVMFQVENKILGYLLPKFILQPLIENAFIHGLEPKIGQGNLIINGKFVENKIVFEVIDDGIGMTEKDLEQLFLQKDYSSKPHKKGAGTGIINIHDRMRILYGDGNGLFIESYPNIGTKVQLAIPLVNEIGGEKIV